MASHKICNAVGCSKANLARGYCSTHYHRLMKKGTVDDAAFKRRNRRLEYIHDTVLTHKGDGCLLWPYVRSPRPSFSIDGRPVNACRYVCEKANGTPPTPKHEAAHSCGKGEDGCISPHHLVWKTHLENEADKIAHGTILDGERHNSARLSQADIAKIRRIGRNLPQRVIADMFGVERSNIGRILRGDTWRKYAAEESPPIRSASCP